MDILKPDVGKLVWLMVGFLVLPKVIAAVKG
jgi:hypothetical protein